MTYSFSYGVLSWIKPLTIWKKSNLSYDIHVLPVPISGLWYADVLEKCCNRLDITRIPRSDYLEHLWDRK